MKELTNPILSFVYFYDRFWMKVSLFFIMEYKFDNNCIFAQTKYLNIKWQIHEYNQTWIISFFCKTSFQIEVHRKVQFRINFLFHFVQNFHCFDIQFPNHAQGCKWYYNMMYNIEMMFNVNSKHNSCLNC